MAPKKNYTPEQMAQALDLVQKGMPVATAAKRTGVPRITLMYKASGKSPRVCSMGPAGSLSLAEEDILVHWILELAKIHYPITKVQLFDSVEYIIKRKPRKHYFKDGRPGDKWFKSFLKRHPELSTRISQNLTTSREAVSEKQIRDWFSEIKEFLTSQDLLHITEEPSRVFNTDESAFFLNPKGDRVITRKGEKNVYNVSGDEKENLTVLVTANAAGKLPPPMIVFSYVRVPSYISESIPKDWGIGTSENGWMCGPTFYCYITNIFVPWLDREHIKRPVLLFMDGHVSHMTLHLSEFCSANGIILIALFPNSTHLLQPMDVSVFRPLKTAWKKEIRNWRVQNDGRKLQKQNFAPVLKNALDCITMDTIKNGFRVSGLCPFNVENIKFDKISANKRSEPKQHEINTLITLKTIEKKIGKVKVTEFEQLFNHGNQCKIEDTSLFLLWQDLFKETEGRNQEQENAQNASQENDEEILEETVQNNNKLATQENIQELVETNNQETRHDNTQEAQQEKTIPEIGKNNNEDPSTIVSCDPAVPSTSSGAFSNGVSMSSLSKSSLPFDVPSPFKGALFWPENPASAKKRKTTEKIPSVVTSAAWQNYHRKKEEKKIRMMEEKKKRSILREQNKLRNKYTKVEGAKKQVFNESGKVKKQKSLNKKKCNTWSESESDEEEWVPSGSSSEGLDEFTDNELNENLPEKDKHEKPLREGDYVLVAFPCENNSFKNYMCVVQEVIDNTDAEVVGMICCNEKKTLFKLNENDVSVIKLSQIIKKMPFPKMSIAGKRLKYEFSEPADVENTLF